MVNTGYMDYKGGRASTGYMDYRVVGLVLVI